MGDRAGVSIWEGDWGGFSTLTSVGYWLVWVGETIPLVWVGVEGLACYTRAIKRVKLGLSDPLLANRFSGACSEPRRCVRWSWRSR